MRVLAFESSAKAASVAILQDENLLGEYYQNSGQTHSRTLMQMAVNLMENCDLSVHDIDAVAVAAGPGSFTGVRIGVAAAKGFAWGRELPCYGVSTLEAMAAFHSSYNGLICPAMDARRNQVYTALFRGGPSVSRLSEDRALSLDELGAELESYEGEKILVGDGALLCYNQLRDSVPNLILAPEHLRLQHAVGVALLAKRLMESGVTGDAAALTPNYLRLSQAERERNARKALNHS